MFISSLVPCETFDIACLRDQSLYLQSASSICLYFGGFYIRYRLALTDEVTEELIRENIKYVNNWLLVLIS
jgi:hypothetical protein